MSRLWIITLVAAAVMAASALAAFAQRRIDAAAARLPDGDGKSEVIAFCAGACHPAARFADMRQSPAEWHKTVMLMVAFGAQLFPEDVEVVTKYFDSYLSDRETPQAK
jgi:hypothetical protein